MSEKTAHSRIGASSMHRWSQCPGSVKLCEGVPNVSSSYAQEGTDAHELAAFRLTEGVYDRHPMADNSEMLEAVETYVEFVEEKRNLPGAMSLIEHKFDLSSLHPGLFGTADAVVYLPKEKVLHVIDYKHGAGVPVEVKENEQLMYYGVGALLSLDKPCVKIVLHVVQPRCSHPDGGIRSWETSPERILDFIADLIDAAKETEKPDAKLYSGEHCRWCPAAGFCPEIKNKAQNIARLEFAQTLPYEPKELQKALDSIPVLESWISGVKSFAYQEATHGRVPPGYKLVEKRALRKWANPSEVAEFFKKEWPHSAASLMTKPTPEPLSVAQVEKVVHKKQHEKLKPFIVAVSSGMTLAPDTDKRQAIRADAKSEFESVPLTENP